MGMKLISLAGLAAAVACGAAQAEDTPITERKQTVESAVATPVEDLNLKKTKIPEVLIRAQANPYDVAAASTCDAVAAEVSAINAELGEDYDDFAKDEGSKVNPAPLLKAGVANFIPFRGVIRQLSGAAGHDREVEQAIDAGFARRGFLKGRALEMNCAPPASPAWFTPAANKAAVTSAVLPVEGAAAPAVVAEAATTASVETPPAPRLTVEAAPLAPIPGASEAFQSQSEPAQPPVSPDATR